MQKKKTFMYDGPVYRFGILIDKRYFGITTAVSERAARNNLIFRYKTEKGYERTSRIELPGKIISVSEQEV